MQTSELIPCQLNCVNNLWFPLQTTLQEVLSHKRVLEMLTEKASALDSDGGELATVQGIGKRYEQLVDRLLTTITQLEDSLDVFQQFTDLTKTHQDYQKQLWDRLSSLTGRCCCLSRGNFTGTIFQHSSLFKMHF